MSIRSAALVCAIVSFLLVPTLLPAQQESRPVIYVTYYRCDAAPEGRLEAIARDKLGPALDKAVSAGRIMAWGWLRHHTGGTWDRAGYLAAPDVGALLNAVEGLGEELSDALDELNAICPDHDDYIWRFVAGSRSGADVARERPPAGYSTYWECDVSHEARADSLVREVFAPVHDRHVGDGRLASWAWWEHHTGGKYRRLVVYDGADHKAVVAAREAIIQELRSEHADALREFGEICGSHQDYLWDIGFPAR